MSRDFGFRKRAEPDPEQQAAFAAASEVRPEGLAGGLSLGQRASASRAAAAETGFTSREPRPVEPPTQPQTAARPGEVVSFEKPAKQKVRGVEPLYSLNMRPRVSVVNRFNKLADRLRMSNPELLEHLLDVYDSVKGDGSEA